jgi:transcriptional regulator with XRE-family HTH domain
MSETTAIDRRLSPVGSRDARRDRVRRVSALAQFLRNRREQLQPADVGLPTGGRRRVAGLRREEVAALAGVSVDYYLRIEQGRERNPSDQVLDGIARALKLDEDGATYMRNLVRRPRSANRCPAKELDPTIHSLIGSWPRTPVHIQDCSLNVVAANPIASALFPQIALGDNPLLSVFLDPDAPKFYRNWDKLTVWAVCWLRAHAVHHPDPGLTSVIEELLLRSERFRLLWSRHDVTHDGSGKMKLLHPEVGPMTLQFQHLTIERSGHVLVAFWAQPGSSSERALQELSGR